MIDWLIDLHLGSGPLSSNAPRPWLGRALCAPYRIMAARNLTTVPDGPQALTPNILWPLGKAGQVRMSEWGQSLALT